jgi:hypothetical protein
MAVNSRLFGHGCAHGRALQAVDQPRMATVSMLLGRLLQALIRPAVRGDSSNLRVGQQVLAIGEAHDLPAQTI